MGKIYMIGTDGKGRVESNRYSTVLSARKAAYRLAKDTDKAVTVFGGYAKLTVEGRVSAPMKTRDAWGGKIFYEYFSETKRKWIIRRLTSDGKLHESYSDVRW